MTYSNSAFGIPPPAADIMPNLQHQNHPNKAARKTPPPNVTFALDDRNPQHVLSSSAYGNAEEYSPPGADASSMSSPGSASDHMGQMLLPPFLPGSGGQQQQPVLSYPGASALAAIEANKPSSNSMNGSSHVNRVITTTTTNNNPPTSSTLNKKKQGAGNQTTVAAASSQIPPAADGNTSGNMMDTTEQEEDSGSSNNGNPKERRQKRLQRNRESARLSRRRRKHYLEHLEERVKNMSENLDKDRRQHVKNAVSTIQQKRLEIITTQQQNKPPSVVSALLLDTAPLSRTSPELMVTTTFQSQQLKSFAVPPSIKFVLWLTLQTEPYFRGGRAPSERLSAARIGERMLSSGTKLASPSQSMWPLLCNEIGLSYDQEEKVRNYQHALLQDPKSWVDRHTTHAATKTINSAHDALQALTVRAGQREKGSMSVLKPDQRLRLLSWSTRNRDRVAQSTARVAIKEEPDNTMVGEKRKMSPHYHAAANLYILNEKLERTFDKVPRAIPLVTGLALKKLSRRPSFESLGASDERGSNLGLSRDASFASSGSLKRSASEMSIDGDEGKSNAPTIAPVEAQAAAAPAVDQALGFLKHLLPQQPALTYHAAFPTIEEQAVLPSPVTAIVPPPAVPSLAYQAPLAATQSAPVLAAVAASHHHERRSSFLPDHLNVVPEEMWPGEGEADDFLLEMMEGDWAIGEGIDMDIPA